MKTISVDSRTGADQWDSFVQSCRTPTAYHQFAWNSVITNSFGHACHYLAAIDELGRWQGILPLVHMRSRIFGNFLISLPFLNYGGLLCKNEEAAALLLDQADRLRRSCGATHVELRHIARRCENLPTRQHKVTMILKLAGSADELWKAFDPKLRNQIRKAQKSGLEFRSGHLDLVESFYGVFARNMRDLGTPVYSKQFFLNVIEAFPESTAIFTVLHEGKTIAAGLGIWFRGRFEIPWASSIKDYQALCPNHMLYWEAIRFAVEHGFQEFDFGRSTPGEGTYNFKKQWGALPIQLNWQYLMDEHGRLPHLDPSNPKFRMAIRAWQHLPVAVTKILGPRIVRNIP